MREEENVLKFDDEIFLDGAERRIEEGDYFGALTLLNKREFRNEPIADAYELYAEIYESLDLWQLAADAWYRFLDTCAREEFQDAYERLAIVFANLGNNLQSNLYYRLAFSDAEEEVFSFGDFIEKKPRLKLVHAEGMEERHPELIAEGLALLKIGNLSAARESFAKIPQDSADYASGAGLSAMCMLMTGDEEGAERECEQLMRSHSENVQILTTYCAVLGAREKRAEAKEIARKLYEIPAEDTDDLYRVATALCEVGLHKEAYEKLSVLKERLPYDNNVLWFHAVAAYRYALESEDPHDCDEVKAAISSLETFTALYPRRAVAAWYLSRLRIFRDEGTQFSMNYYYRLPESEYRRVAAYLLSVSSNGDEEIAKSSEFAENFRLAFDEMEGHDEKLQLLAAKVAVRFRADSLVRSVLLDCEGDEIVKIAVLHDLVCRNEDNSFGVVFLNLYKELFTHELQIDGKKGGEFLQAFADVYAKYAMFGEDNEGKICAAGEDIYAALSEAGAWELFDDRAELAAAIYREARIKGGERTLEEICKLFDANLIKTQIILDYMM